MSVQDVNPPESPRIVEAEIVGDRELLEELRRLSIAVYQRGAEHARERGIILADTKFEFGLRDGRLVLADEVLTPDSSRFWDAAAWQPGRSLPSFDKQYVRDWLTENSGWDRVSAPPPLPPDCWWLPGWTFSLGWTST